MDNYREKIVRIVERELKRTEEYQQRRDEYGSEEYILGCIMVKGDAFPKEVIAHAFVEDIPDDWYVSEQVTDTLSAMLFYNEDATEHTFSLYINKTGLPFGYFFCQGGIDASIQSSVREFNVKGAREKVYISMNSRKANSVTISNTIEITKEEIDPDKPFVLAIDELSLVEFFDADGNSVY